MIEIKFYWKKIKCIEVTLCSSLHAILIDDKCFDIWNRLCKIHQGNRIKNLVQSITKIFITLNSNNWYNYIICMWGPEKTTDIEA